MTTENKEIDLLELWKSIKAAFLETFVNLYLFTIRYRFFLAAFLFLGIGWGIFKTLSKPKVYYGTLTAHSVVADRETLIDILSPVVSMVEFGDIDGLRRVLKTDSVIVNSLLTMTVDTVALKNQIRLKVQTSSRVDYNKIRDNIVGFLASNEHLAQQYESYITKLDEQIFAVEKEIVKLDSLQNMALQTQMQRLKTKDYVILNEDTKKSYSSEILDLNNTRLDYVQSKKYTKIVTVIKDFSVVEDSPANSWKRSGFFSGLIMFFVAFFLAKFKDWFLALKQKAEIHQ